MNEIERKYFNAFYSFVENKMSVEFTKELDSEVFSKTNVKCSVVPEMTNIEMGTFGFNLNIKKTACCKYETYGEINNSFEITCGNQTFDTNGYIPDFRILGSGKFCNFIIEIDGHQWHEKTKEQAAKDKMKDRVYLKNNSIPIRFTGSEVYHDPFNCVKDTIEIIARFEITNNQNLKIKE